MLTDRVARPAPPSGDAGVSLLEVLVSIFVIATVMASVAPFLVRSLAVSDQQRSEQIAVQVANDGIERARGLDPSSLLTGRSATATQTQWLSAPADVKALLPAGLDSDPMLPPTATKGLRAPLPTEANRVRVNGIAFDQRWYVGRCWQPKADTTHTNIGSCGATVTGVAFFRVVVSVTWARPSCPAQGCVYVASTLVSSANDPVFDTKRPAPTVTDPGNQYSYVASAADLQFVSSGGRLPLTWSITGLPPGLTMSSTARVTGTATTAGTYSVVVKVTDKDGRTDDSAFTWTVVNDVALANPGDQSSRTGTTATLAMTASGGVPALSWTAAGLPSGLTMNASSGVISGNTPSAKQTATVTVSVKDARNRTATTTFLWRFAPALTLVNPGPQSENINTSVDYQLYASGGWPDYTWQADNLPTGLSIDTRTGRVTGTLRSATRYITTVTVTDSIGAKATMDVVIIVTVPTNDLTVTAPNPSNPNQSTTAGASVSITAASTGVGNSPRTWQATNLPPGLSITTGGVISGRPTTKGTYRVSLVVATNSKSATLMFDWRVT